MGTGDRTINLVVLNAGAGMLVADEMNWKGRNDDLPPPFFFFQLKSLAFSDSLKVDALSGLTSRCQSIPTVPGAAEPRHTPRGLQSPLAPHHPKPGSAP